MLKIGEIYKVGGRDISYEFSRILFNILQGPTLFICNLEYLPLGSISFLRNAQNLSPTWKCASFLLFIAFSLYFKADFRKVSFPYCYTLVMSSTNYWPWALNPMVP